MGRPPRSHRGGSNSRDVGLTDDVYCWDEDINAPGVSGDDDPAMILGYMAEPLDLLNYFGNPGALNDLFASGGPTVTTSTIPTSSTSFGDSSLNDLSTSTMLIDYSGDKRGLDSPKELAAADTAVRVERGTLPTPSAPREGQDSIPEVVRLGQREQCTSKQSNEQRTVARSERRRPGHREATPGDKPAEGYRHGAPVPQGWEPSKGRGE
ncbi:hypothetical protein B7463_g9012, partial [Scytalidium lignicola]